MTGYSEEQLVGNRAAVLLYGGAESERRAWAQRAAQSHAGTGTGLIEVADEKALPAALAKAEGVVFIVDGTRLGWDAQREVVRVLREKEERPKLVVGLSMPLEKAFEKGLLRDDFHWAFRRGLIDMANVKKRPAAPAKAKK